MRRKSIIYIRMNTYLSKKQINPFIAQAGINLLTACYQVYEPKLAIFKFSFVDCSAASRKLAYCPVFEQDM